MLNIKSFNQSAVGLIVLAAMITTLSGCKENYLSVHSDYVSIENLASYVIHTPDPRLHYPPIGQRLIINWSVPRSYLEFEDLHLNLTVRYRDKEEIFEEINITQRKGTYVFSLMNEDYINKRGILTYKLDLIGDGLLLEEWRHQIWSDLIFINESKVEDLHQDVIEDILTPIDDQGSCYDDDF